MELTAGTLRLIWTANGSIPRQLATFRNHCLTLERLYVFMRSDDGGTPLIVGVSLQLHCNTCTTQPKDAACCSYDSLTYCVATDVTCTPCSHPAPETLKDPSLHQNSSIAGQGISLPSCIREVSASVSGMQIVFRGNTQCLQKNTDTIEQINQVTMTHGWISQKQ
jgi:hypothetical protein